MLPAGQKVSASQFCTAVGMGDNCFAAASPALLLLPIFGITSHQISRSSLELALYLPEPELTVLSRAPE